MMKIFLRGVLDAGRIIFSAPYKNESPFLKIWLPAIEEM
jgi:hypothetical protein